MRPFIAALLCFQLCFATSYTSNATGTNWSQSTHWTPNGVPGDGDCPTVATNTVINTSIGTNGNGLTCNITVTSGAALTRDSSPHSIYFASTGTNPIGSGTATAPGLDATMLGFFNYTGGQIKFDGALDGNGACTNTLTISSGDGVHPWYIFSYHNGSDFVFECIDGSHIGTSVDNYQGIAASSGYQNFLFKINHNRLTDLFSIKLIGGPDAAGTITYNLFDEVRASLSDGNGVGTIAGPGFAGSVAMVVADNTEINPVNNSHFFIPNVIANNSTFARNAAHGTATASKSLGFIPSGSSGHTVLNNLAINSKTTSGPITMSIRSNTTTLRGNYMAGGFNAAIDCGATTGTVNTFNFIAAESYSSASQGSIICSQPVSTDNNHNVILYETVAEPFTPSVGIFAWSTGITGFLVNSNTLLGPPCHNGGSIGTTSHSIQIGEPGDTGTLNIARNNLIGCWIRGYQDDAGTDYAVDPTVGVHHNAFFGNTADFANPNGLGEANFGTAHPNAAYGEIILSASPRFFDPTRRLTTWDTSLGGPGTVANVFAELAKRSGFGGTANPAYNIASLVSYTLYGFRPYNTDLRGAASDGSAIGAMPVVSGIRSVSSNSRSAGRSR